MRARTAFEDAPLADKGGPALKRAIHVARARAGVTSDMQLALQAGISYDTLMNWYGDRTVPRGAELKKVAEALGVSYSTLQAAYDGTDPEPAPLQDAIRELVDELRLSRAQQDEATMALLQALAALLPRGQERPETSDDNEPAARAGKKR